LKSNNENFQVFWAQKVFGLCLYFLKTLKLFDVTPGQRKINQKCKYKGVFDVRLSQGKIEHPTFFKKRDPNGQKTKIFGFPTIRANIHTCFLPITNVYKTSLSIFNITLKLITCSMFFFLIYFEIRYLTAIIFDETRITIRATNTKKY
jgi:hypothetical protein